MRLAPILLPFSIVGPGFGANLDVKYWFTNKARRLQSSVVLGVGGAHVVIEGNTRLAYSPNAAALGTMRMSERTDLTVMARGVHLAIPTAAGGARSNFVNILGPAVGVLRSINATMSILPEVGAYWYDGRIGGVSKQGPGFQYGVMIATSFWCGVPEIPCTRNPVPSRVCQGGATSRARRHGEEPQRRPARDGAGFLRGISGTPH